MNRMKLHPYIILFFLVSPLLSFPLPPLFFPFLRFPMLLIPLAIYNIIRLPDGRACRSPSHWLEGPSGLDNLALLLCSAPPPFLLFPSFCSDVMLALGILLCCIWTLDSYFILSFWARRLFLSFFPPLTSIPLFSPSLVLAPLQPNSWLGPEGRPRELL